MRKRMRTRILFGSIMIVLIAALLYADWWLEHTRRPVLRLGCGDESTVEVVRGIPLAALCLVLVAVALKEVARLAQGVGVQVLRVSGLVGCCTVATLPFWWQFLDAKGPSGLEVLLILGLIVMMIFAEQMIRFRTADALRQIACTGLTVLYLGVGMALILGIRTTYGDPVLLLFLAAVKFTDIGAYFTGSAVGRHKLIPWLSPGKSWEGLAGGLVAGAGVSALIAWWGDLTVLSRPMETWEAAVFGAVVGLVGQFADLCESLLKRAANTKDAGALVPEFGGLLDILDSPLLSAPVAMVLLKLWG